MAGKQPKAPKQQSLWTDTTEIGPTSVSRSMHTITATTGNSTSFQVWAKVNSHATWLFIDLGSSANHMLSQFAAEYQILLQKKKQSYSLNTFEETPMTYNNGQVTHHTCLVGFWLGHHWEKMKFNITETLRNNIILGIPWLRQWNPQIDWANEQIFFIRDPKSLKLYAVPQLNDHIDCDIQVLLATEMKTLAKKDNTYVLWTKEISATLLIEILEKYKDF